MFNQGLFDQSHNGTYAHSAPSVGALMASRRIYSSVANKHAFRAFLWSVSRSDHKYPRDQSFLIPLSIAMERG
jgi:hypothetical protein